MKDCCIDETTGQKYGWGRVLDHIGIGWDYDKNGNMINASGQISLW